MKINPITNPNILKNYRSAKTARVEADVKSRRDEVTFSAEALSFSKVMAQAGYRSRAERQHIADVTSAVKQGRYRIDSDVIADRILNQTTDDVWQMARGDG